MFLTHFGVQGLWAPMWPPIEKGDYTEAGMVALIEGLRANASLTLCDVIHVVGYGVLGDALTKKRQTRQLADPPDSSIAFVDPAGLHHVQQVGPSGAGGAAGAI